MGDFLNYLSTHELFGEVDYIVTHDINKQKETKILPVTFSTTPYRWHTKQTLYVQDDDYINHI